MQQKHRLHNSLAACKIRCSWLIFNTAVFLKSDFQITTLLIEAYAFRFSLASVNRWIASRMRQVMDPWIIT